MKVSLKALLAALLIIFTGCDNSGAPLTESGNALTVHFLDVGQADCEIITLPQGEVLMIDAGNNDDDYLICNYLDSLGIKTIDYLVGTHPHEDHIGSLDVVINNYNVKKLYMPDASADTKTYRDTVKAAAQNSLDIITASAGMDIYSDDELKIKIIAPVHSYSDLNDESIVIKLTYKRSSFLFTGDAGEKSENDITADVSADVLKVGHHGSRTASSVGFLERVDPMYAVISCGKDNSYGHPHYETLSNLSDNDITVYRTDKSGTLICTTYGNGPADYQWESK